MNVLLRVVIVLAAMVAGGYLAAEIADRFYLSEAGPGEWGMAAAQFTIVVIIPSAAILSGVIALIFTRKRKRRPVV